MKFLDNKSSEFTTANCGKNTKDFLSHISNIKCADKSQVYKQIVITLVDFYLSPLYLAFRHHRDIASNIIKYVNDDWDPFFVAHAWYNNDFKLDKEGQMKRILTFLCAAQYNTNTCNIQTLIHL